MKEVVKLDNAVTDRKILDLILSFLCKNYKKNQQDFMKTKKVVGKFAFPSGFYILLKKEACYAFINDPRKERIENKSIPHEKNNCVFLSLREFLNDNNEMISVPHFK